MSTSNRSPKKGAQAKARPKPNSSPSKSFFPFSLPLYIASILICSLLVQSLLPIPPLRAYLPSALLSAFPFLSEYPSNPHSPVSYTSAPAELNGIPHSIRARWMHHAISALPAQLSTPCPFAPFSAVIVNHTSPSPSSTHDPGSEICVGVNAISQTGAPHLHGEISAIQNCTAILSRPPYSLSPSEILAAWSHLTIYTTGEPCPMCASAIRWAGFRECVYATSIEALKGMGWGQIDIESREVFGRSGGVGGKGEVTALLGGVETEVTDRLFGWQFRGDAECPPGCQRDREETDCRKIS